MQFTYILIFKRLKLVFWYVYKNVRRSFRVYKLNCELTIIITTISEELAAFYVSAQTR